MIHLLVNLTELEDIFPLIKKQKKLGIEFRRAGASEKQELCDWVSKRFHYMWVSECEVAFSNHPVSCFIAVKDKEILGFACYDATDKAFFGPGGVDVEHRKQGLGKILLLLCLHAMASEGLQYAVIPTDKGLKKFYSKVATVGEIIGERIGVFEHYF